MAGDGDGHQNVAVLLSAGNCNQKLIPVRELRVVGVGPEIRRHRRCQSIHACMVLHADIGTASPLAPPTFPNFVRQLQATRPLCTGWRSEDGRPEATAEVHAWMYVRELGTDIRALPI